MLGGGWQLLPNGLWEFLKTAVLKFLLIFGKNSFHKASVCLRGVETLSGRMPFEHAFFLRGASLKRLEQKCVFWGYIAFEKSTEISIQIEIDRASFRQLHSYFCQILSDTCHSYPFHIFWLNTQSNAIFCASDLGHSSVATTDPIDLAARF